MPDFKPAILASGIVLCALGVLMLIPAATDLLSDTSDWLVFPISSGLTLFVGLCLMISAPYRHWAHEGRLGRRQIFLLVNCTWVVSGLFGALPFVLSGGGVGAHLSFTDAFFESVSGITTTGATVLHDLDLLPPGILLWRGLLQWLGGIGILVTALAVLPGLHVGGTQFFEVEGFGVEKFATRASQMAAAIGGVYLFLTFVSALFFWLFGMTGLEAAVHAMTAIATGGFGTEDSSFAHFSRPALQWTAIATMIAGSLPFALYLHALRGQVSALWKDDQALGFLGLLGVSIAIVTCWLVFTTPDSFFTTFQSATFNTVSIITGTGYTSTDFSAWGNLTTPFFIILMLIGGCGGSTTCGIKFFRLRILFALTIAHLRRLAEPSGVFGTRSGSKKLDGNQKESVAVFLFVFLATFALLAVALGACGLDLLTAVSAAASAVANVGPGLGPVVGPLGNYASLPDVAKVFLIVGMLLGRLEILAVLTLLLPSFWKR